MNSNFTDGAWNLDVTGYLPRVVANYADGAKATIASFPLGAFYHNETPSVPLTSLEEATANAALCALAPEMLCLLQSAVQEVPEGSLKESIRAALNRVPPEYLTKP